MLIWEKQAIIHPPASRMHLHNDGPMVDHVFASPWTLNLREVSWATTLLTLPCFNTQIAMSASLCLISVTRQITISLDLLSSLQTILSILKAHILNPIPPSMNVYYSITWSQDWHVQPCQIFFSLEQPSNVI